MNQSDTAPCTRVVVELEGSKVRPRVVLPRKENNMKYRDFNPNSPCLPAEAYPYLWQTLLANPPQPAPPTLWERTIGWINRLSRALPLIAAVAVTTAATSERNDLIHTLVWVQPHPGKEMPAPPTLPLVEGNPYSF